MTRTVGSSVYALSYDAENRLTGVNGAATATFLYDGDGNRVRETVAGRSTLYLGIYFEWSVTPRVKYYYAGASGQRMAMRDAGGTLYCLLIGHLPSGPLIYSRACPLSIGLKLISLPFKTICGACRAWPGARGSWQWSRPMPMGMAP